MVCLLPGLRLSFMAGLMYSWEGPSATRKLGEHNRYEKTLSHSSLPILPFRIPPSQRGDQGQQEPGLEPGFQALGFPSSVLHSWFDDWKENRIILAKSNELTV